ncbi:MAG: 5-formyltetrahydrofolate cyclo-ligase [Lentimicrobium sp.]|nr:5-formyltetrahydrofolate cyclo-ligase [Lentimicrobium sp.]
MNDLFLQKKLLRQEVKHRKSLQNPDDYFRASATIMNKLEQLPEFNDAAIVLAYWSVPGEVFTHDFVKRWSESRRILLPSVDGDTMLIKEYNSENSLIPGDLYGIPEPDGQIFTEYELIDFAIVPGVAFDRNNNRMGRGKAYYDKFLSSIKTFKAGVCFDFQMFDEVPADENDILMDVVITEFN